jgi:hypothetical protein
VLEVPKTPIEQDVLSSVTPDGDLLHWAFPGTMHAEKVEQTKVDLGLT